MAKNKKQVMKYTIEFEVEPELVKYVDMQEILDKMCETGYAEVVKSELADRKEF